MRKKGYTLTEIIVVIAIIALLATLSTVMVRRARERAKLSRVSNELQSIATSVTQYAQDNNFQYPADATRSVPPGLEKYLVGGKWPDSVWPNGVYDWENWQNSSGVQIYQITYRLCDIGDPEASCKDSMIFPNFERNSGIYYCIQGPCVPHQSTPNVPGYCVNCKTKEVNY